ncbi:MFS transporter [Kordiimonas marina]|uniref:MFS transporter n=1 Tax=Kordiimonas marina TaxID=2872312 RepID=UPI001FF5D74F|nr:MFS transporter [Kordiimonas marina]
MTGGSTRFYTSRRFLPLFVTQFLGALNDNLFRQALIMLITYRIAEQLAVKPAVLNNLAIGLFILPFFLFSALAGQLADKHEKSVQIFWIKVWEIGLALMGALGFYLHSLPLLIGVLSGLGLQSTFFGPIKYGILPDLMKKEDLLSANALVEAGTFIAILMGTIIGSYVVLKSGGVSVIATLTILVAVIGTISGRMVPKTGRAAPDLELTVNIFKATGAQLKAAWAHPVARPAIIGISWIWLFGSLFITQIPDIVKNRIGGDESVATLILACFSVGIGAGSMLSSKLLKGNISAHLAAPALIALSVLGAALFLLLPAGPGDHLIGLGVFLSDIRGVALVAVLLLIAMAAGVVVVPLYTILQDRTAREERSRMIAATNIVNSGFMAGGSILASILIAFGMTTPMVLLLTSLSSLMFLRTARHLERQL